MMKTIAVEIGEATKGNPKGEITGKGLRDCIASTIFFIGKYLYSLH
jgi:hypothetical protein